MLNLNHSRVARWPYLDQLFLAILAGISTYLLIGDLGVRMANTSTDDGLVSYSYFLKFPERFAMDANLRNWAPAGLASMLNWLPALLFKYAGVPPDFFFGLFIYLQNILLALAMHRLTIVMTASRQSALIAAVFTLAFRPHWWNMGLFADLDWMPYGAWMALPFLIFAGAFALERRITMTAALLMIGGLIHPILGLFAGAMFGVYWGLLALAGRGWRELVTVSAAIGFAGLVFMAPAINARLGTEEVQASHLLGLVLRNGHAIPWANPGCSYCMPLFVGGSTMVPLMALLAITAAKRRLMHPMLLPFLKACIVMAFVACLLHFAAYFAGEPGILRMVSTRSTMLLLAFAVPPVIALSVDVVSESRLPGRVIAAFFLVLPSAATGLALLLAQAWGSASSPITAAGAWARRAAYVAATILLALVALRFFPQIREFVNAYFIDRILPPLYQPQFFNQHSWGTKLPFLAVAVAAGLAWLMARVIFVQRHYGAGVASVRPVFILTMLAVYLLVTNHKAGLSGTSGEAREYYEVQVWARESTPADASFIVSGTSVYEGWRNYTHRARISVGGCGFYICSKSGLEEGERAAAFFARHGNAGLTGLDTAGLREFARTFGGDYVVRRKAWAPVDFPIVFENAGYIVYDLR